MRPGDALAMVAAKAGMDIGDVKEAAHVAPSVTPAPALTMHRTERERLARVVLEAAMGLPL